ncbi:tetratricopeptide repeat protein [Nocardia rhizosphaerihabitans]|uniref:Tetratricopeptide repeat protein n=1 Tax=Nocardia rhizosphaerihabitans TaxID=1691570 RepID=A0ABQ2K5F3_9NOCA|nr:tetratricopeptide repeat protein [Nocardia rhizosphaerihabitans]GGN66221.1 hypothetical protein GCM10011610_00960 [Nocardia rhizosphaerihabitans]
MGSTDWESTASALIATAIDHYGHGRFADGDSVFDQARSLTANQEDHFRLAELDLRRATALYEAGRYDGSEEFASAAEATYEQHSAHTEAAGCALLAGTAALARDHGANAQAHCLRAREIFHSLEMADRVADTDAVLGSAYLREHQFTAAEDTLQRAAQHYAAAGLDDKAQRLRRAASDARGQRLHTDAVGYLTASDLEQAMTAFEQARVSFADADNCRGVAQCHDNIGRIHLREGRIVKAEEHLRHAIEGYRSPAQGPVHSPLLVLALLLHRTDRSPEAVGLAVESRVTARQNGDLAAAGSASILAAAILSLSDLDAALVEYQIARTLLIEADLPDKVAQVDNNIGAIEHKRGMLRAAADAFRSAAQGYERLGQDQPMRSARSSHAATIVAIGDRERTAGNHDAALHCYAEACQLYDDLADHRWAAGCHARVGDIHLTRGDHDAAVEAYTTARSRYDNADAAAIEIAICEDNLARAHAAARRLEDAVAAWDRARSGYLEADRVDASTECQRRSAATVRAWAIQLRDAGQHPEAAPQFHDAAQRYRSIGLDSDAATCLQQQAYLTRALGDHDTATHAYTGAADLYEHNHHHREAGRCLLALGDMHISTSRFADAAAALQRAADLHRIAGETVGTEACELGCAAAHQAAGRQFLDADRPLDAVPDLTHAARLFRQHKQHQPAADCLTALADAHAGCGDPVAALSNRLEARTILRGLGALGKVTACEFNIGSDHRARGDITAAIESYSTARHLAMHLSHTVVIEQAGKQLTDLRQHPAAVDQARQDTELDKGHERYRLGIDHLQKDEWEPALGAFRDARAHYEGHDLLVAQCDRALGDTARETCDYAKALDYFERAAEGYRATGFFSLLALCTRSMAEVHNLLADVTTAIDSYDTAIAHYEHSGDLFGLAECLASAGDANRIAERYDIAAQYLDRAKEMFTARRRADRVAVSTLNRSMVHVAVGEIDQAEAGLNEALPFFERVDDRLGIAQCHNGFARVQLKRGLNAEAVACLERAIAQLRGTRHQFVLAQNLWLSAVTRMEQPDNHDAALHAVTEASAIYVELGLDRWRATSSRTHAGILLRAGRLDAAEAYYLDARTSFQRLGRDTDVADCEFDLADMYFGAGRFHETLTVLAHAIEIYDEHEQHQKAARSRRLAGQAHRTLGQFPAATAAFESARAQFQALDLPEDLAQCNYLLGSVYLWSDDRPEDGEAPLTAALEAASTLGMDGLRITCEQGLGALYRRMGRYTQARDLLTRALSAARSHDLAEMIANCLASMGLLEETLERYDQAEQYLLQAREVNIERNDALGTAQNQRNLGAVYQKTGRVSEAREAVAAAWQIYKQHEIGRSVADCEHTLGDLASRVEQLDEAEQWQTSARAEFARLGILTGVAECDVSLGNIHSARQHHTLAIDAHRSALDAFERLGDELGVAACAHNLGTLYSQLLKFAEATDYFRRARAVYLEHGLQNSIASVDLALASIEFRRCQLEGLVDYQRYIKLAAVLEDSLPALIFLDAQRFQFPKAATRHAWTRTVRSYLVDAFACAAQLGTATILADLVETVLNSGVHSVTAHPNTQSTDPHGLDDGNQIAASEDVDDIVKEGAGMFFTADHLPMSPPPMLLMPDGRLALERYYRQADLRYRPVARPSPVRTW